MEPTSGGTERFLSVRFSTAAGPVNVLGVYVPTLCTPGGVKDRFYEQLDNLIDMIPQAESLLLLGESVLTMNPGPHVLVPMALEG